MNWYKQAKQEWARWQIVEMLEKAFKLPPEGMMKTHPRGPFELEIGPKAMDNPKCMDFMNAARDIKAHMCIGMHFPDERSPEQDGTIVANGTISSKNEGELLGDTTFVNSWMLSELNQVPFDIVNTVYAIIDSPDDGDEEEEIEFDPSPLDPELVPVSATSSLKILSMNWYKYSILTDQERQSLENTHPGSRIIEEVNIGGYDLFISTIPSSPMPQLPAYQIGLKREDLDMSAPQAQFGQQDFQIPEQNVTSILQQMQNKINAWLSQYGPLLAASMNPKKNKQYALMLQRLGFSINSIDLGGIKGLIINV